VDYRVNIVLLPSRVKAVSGYVNKLTKRFTKRESRRLNIIY